ncbi:Non-catalytic module family CDH [Pseudocercospora fijiensis CIRAD86]|uniref:Non-catalytic module family CDH n=1 Tax=Pseudocercospora fijiensis (strain CIRAD86) TaxID=383855 RepID=M2ZEM9_PSEFD|nr:Non-catalytic module family CDH [Pseudocercospora fijiensis CIRAD86]EME77589.1 Non-catalytic module family CDH [Pseudocercospora fijiensis CIRAD86]
MLEFRSFLITAALWAGATAQLKKEYDYIVCGGGTAGLAVANRLSADPKNSVLVVEAGINGTTAYWNYHSLPQKYANGRIQDLPAGKTVGGSSQINGRVYSRPDRRSIDDWGNVNNAGWSWEKLFPFYKASEGLQPPTKQQQRDLENKYNPDYHGTAGPVNITYPAVGVPDYFRLLEETAKAFSIPRIRDFNGGDARGLSTYPGFFVINAQREQRRESSREAYYLPIVGRTNLELIDETMCQRIDWEKSSDGGDLKAHGVEISNVDNKTVIHARKEVILSAGVYRTPGILEYSGIGNPKILKSHKIDTKVDLPGVGENLQDQAQGNIFFNKNSNASITFPDTVGEEIITNYLIHATYEDILGNEAASMQQRVNASLGDYATTISNRINNSLSSDQILNSLQVQYDAIFNTPVPVVEIFSGQAVNNNVVNMEFWPLIPLSRGSCHIAGANADLAAEAPFIDVNWFMLEWDWEIYIAAGRFVRKLFATQPLANLTTEETQPGYKNLALDASDDEWKDYWSDNFRAGWHGIGTAAMLPRKWGGVVDGNLKVYGTSNVRVCDASAVPFNMGGHPTSTMYALAERAAHLILTGEKG